MKLNDHSMLWNHAFIRLMDIRYNTMDQGEQLHAYRLPSSAFLFFTRGRARLRLDGLAESSVNRFHLLHAGKGLCLDLLAEEQLEYYIILYKATLALPCRQEIQKLMEEHNPFQIQYEFDPHFPLALYDQVEKMNQVWLQSNVVDKLQVKSLFYHFVYEVLMQLERQDVMIHKPDLAGQAIRYIQDHYKEPITLAALAESLDCSPRQLLRMFKERMNASPIDYLIQQRMLKAKQRLLTTNFTLQEIAESVGYSDSYYFSRMFKKYEGVSPTAFKENAHRKEKSPYNPSGLSRYSIAGGKLRRYIDDGYENHYQYKREGDLLMFRKSTTSMLATLLFCITLLLSACANGTNQSNPTGGMDASGKPAASASQASQTPEPDTPRVIKHAMGEVTITGTPKRVIILTNEGTEALLALGIKPIGAVKSWIGDPWYNHIKDDMKDVTVVGDEMQPNLEMIASLKPDLIIGNKVRQEKVYEQLKKIAPTVFSEDLGGDWRANFKLYMEAVNKKEEGNKALAAFDKRVNEVKAKLGNKAATKISVVRFSASQVRIYQKQTFSGVLLSQLGFARPASQDKDGNIEVMTKEKLPDMDGDVMFYFVTETAGKNDASKVVQEWMNEPLFKNLNVSKNNKIKQVDEAIWNSAGGYEAANLLLDDLVTYFDVK
ncbi:AraC family transcriptional regulator [Paenibacillus sp. RC67]|uniref:AraC family transcriptional regulator n=1 Tax=Paenibacillus sp. RC67 TaxID=3039392 RepID=UPI0024ADCB87|nr:AraC family transcriptional regulator [Paenibacillus sp. RC67]